MLFDKMKLKISVLSISLVLTSTGAVSMLIPSLLSAYPGENTSVIESIITLSTLSTFILVLMNDKIVRKIGYRPTVMLGLILTFVGGVGPAMISSFKLILFLRVVLGAGLGLCNPLAVSLINLFFVEEKERASMLGLQNAVSGLGLTLMTFVAGVLSLYSWKYSFFVYLVLIPVFFLFFLFVPEPEAGPLVKQEKTADGKIVKPKISSVVFLLAFVIFSFFVFYFTMALKGASLIVDKGLGTTLDAGNILSLRSLATMIGGALFGQIYKVTKKATLVVSYLCICAASFLLYASTSLFQVGLGMVLGGLSSAILIPYVYMMVGKYAFKGSENLSVSAIIVGSNSGVFLSPYIINFIPQFFHQETTIFPFLIAGFVFLILGIGSLILVLLKKISG